MNGFRTREMELKELIKCYLQCDDPDIVLDIKSTYNVTVKKFLLDEIIKLSSSQISATMNNNCIKFAYDIAIPLFEFNKELFTTIFQNEVNKNCMQVGFDYIFTIICGFKNTEIVIITCNAIYKSVESSTDNNKNEKHQKILNKLKSFSDAELGGLDGDVLTDLRNLISSLEASISS